MKTLLAIISLILGLGSVSAQQTHPQSNTNSVTSKLQKMETAEKKTVEKKAIQPQQMTISPAVKLKKDGTPDRRYKANQHLKKDGTPDKRYKAK